MGGTEWWVYLILSTVLLLWPITLFYTTSLVVVPTFWPKRKYVYIVAILIILYPIHLFCYFLRYRFMEWLSNEGEMAMEILATERFLRRYTWWFLYFVFVAVVFSLYKLAVEELQKRNDIEKEIINTQSRFFRTQLNSQFLLGTLNAMHRKALNTSQDLSEAIRLLAKIVNYSLRTDNPAKMVSITNEIEQVKSFIALNQLRFNNQIFINFHVQGVIAGVKILPLVLISLVENALKHGELRDPLFPVHIGVDITLDHIHVLIFNKKKTGGTTVISHGIGEKNTILRLRMAYDDRYKLNIDDKDEFYRCDLKIYNL